MLLLDHVENDGVFSPKAWADIGAAAPHAARADRRGLWLAGRLCDRHGRRSTIARARDWPRFWGEQRLIATAACSTGPGASGSSGWRRGSASCCPPRPPPALLHGDLWTGNILVRDGRLVGAGRSGLLLRRCRGRSRHARPVLHAARGILGGLWSARAGLAGAAADLPAVPRAGARAALGRGLLRRWSSGCSRVGA